MKAHPRLLSILLTILATLLSVGSLRAGSILWDNGPVVGDTRTCDSTPTLCGGTGGWMIYDNFQVGPATVTGFTFNDYVDDNGNTGHTYLGTYWGIWASDPMTGSVPIASGTSLAALTAGGSGSTLFTVTGLDIGLSGGEYWLGTGNVLDSNTLTDRAYVSTTILSGWEQSQVGGVPYLLPYPDSNGYINGVFNTAFTVEGVSAPEPGSMLSVFFALVAIYALRRRSIRDLAAAQDDGRK
jgi:hypothetical protein